MWLAQPFSRELWNEHGVSLHYRVGRAVARSALTLDPTAIKAMLKENSSVPELDPGAFHPLWGFGLIDAGSL